MRTILTTRYQDPFTSMQRVLADVIGGVSQTEAAAMRVRMDVHEDDRAFYVTADLPGLSEKEVEVSFDEGVLTLRGEKKLERSAEKDTWHIAERVSGSFARSLSLNAPILADKIEAKFEKGVLTVTLPKQAEEKPQARKIEIKSA